MSRRLAVMAGIAAGLATNFALDFAGLTTLGGLIGGAVTGVTILLLWPRD